MPEKFQETLFKLANEILSSLNNTNKRELKRPVEKLQRFFSRRVCQMRLNFLIKIKLCVTTIFRAGCAISMRKSD